MTDQTIPVILSQAEGDDPRPTDEKTRKRATIRVVLHQIAKRVLIEIEDGKDAVGSPHWRRVDTQEDRDEVRAAYDIVERILADYYKRAISAEDRVIKAESRIAQLLSPKAPILTTPPDPLAPIKQKIADLIELAGRPEAPDEERRNAGVKAAELIRKHNLRAR